MAFPVPLAKLNKFLIVLAVTLTTISTPPSTLVRAQGLRQVSLNQFDMLNATTGWILLDRHLFWTSDAGITWKDISPSLPGKATLQDVRFIDDHTGWVLWILENPDGSDRFQLAQTSDRGLTWNVQSLSLFAPGDTASYVEKAQMEWLDGQIGWISVKQETSSNFSLGSLFNSTDGGSTWSRAPLPVAGEIEFADSQNGWLIGGPGGSQIFNTQDGGKAWQKSEPSELPESAEILAYHPFVSGNQGLLAAVSMGTGSHLSVYSLRADSAQWQPMGSQKLDVQPGMIGLSILDAQNLVAVIPGTTSIVRMMGGQFSTLKNMDGLSASIVDLDMVSLDVGWAKWVDASCSKDSSASCISITRLLQTTDGGATWTALQIPLIQSAEIASDFASQSSAAPGAGEITNLQNTQTFVGQGFDKCEIPTLSQMQTWSTASPYKTVNLYVGGSSRACQNSALVSSYLFQLFQQGWKFIPTWVGPQAPCTGFPSRLSSDPATAYNQGVAEANLAVDRLAALGLTGPDKTGSIIYYDMEAYGTNQSCRSAVNSFMNGWVFQLRARGNLAGVYGSTLCYTGLSDFLTIPNVPDAIWAARWYHNPGYGYYDPTASVWDLGSCIPNTAWANHQRIRQYEGDHNETWGGLTLNIDSNVLDGIVAVPYGYLYVSSIVRLNASPTGAGTVGFTITFSKPVTGVDISDLKLTMAGVRNASILSVSGSGSTYTVTVSTGSGDGTIRLDVLDDDSIKDASNTPLGGAGTGNGIYSSGERYNIVRGADTVGVFRPSNGVIFLKNTNATGYADVALNYGVGGDYPIAGDWDGNGTDTIGVYRGDKFYLRNSNTIGYADVSFTFGSTGDQPVAGDWDGDGIDTIGVYHSSTFTFYLRNSNTAGPADMIFSLGVPGDVGIAGDWDGDGRDTTGVFRPSNGVIFLKNTNATGYADVALNYGIGGDKPVTGDWNNDGTDTIGVLRGITFYLRNSNTVGYADMRFDLGIPGDMPIAGNWDGIP